jgi:uncharacterized membrane protein
MGSRCCVSTGRRATSTTLVAAEDLRSDPDRWRRAIRLGPERTMRQDPAFGLRQLVDIAERALSPGVNDPSTAVQCLDRIHDLLRAAALRPVHDLAVGSVEGTVAAWMPMHGFADLLALGLDEPRHWGSGSLQIHRKLDAILTDLHDVVVGDPARRRLILEQRQLLDARRSDLPPSELRRLAPDVRSAGTHRSDGLTSSAGG